MSTSDEDDLLSWELLHRIVLLPGLPEARLTAAAWMLETLERHFGESWPAKVSAAADDLRSILVCSGSHVYGFGTVLDLSLRLEQFQKTSGFGKVRKDLRSDARVSRWLHHRAALEVGALGAAERGAIEFEPAIKDVSGPADIRICHGCHEVIVEVRILETDQAFREADRQFHRLEVERFALQFEHHVDIEVDAEEIPDDETMERTLALMRDVAAASAARSLWIERTLGPRIKVAAGPESTGAATSVRGPLYQQTDGLRRLRLVLSKKAAKYSTGRPVWLRLDMLDGLFAISSWAQAPLQQQLDDIAAAMRQELASASGIAGIVLTSGATALSSGSPGQSVRNPTTGDVALHRQLPLYRERLTFIVPLRPEAVDDALLWRTMYDNEPSWLAGALAEAGLPPLSALDPGWSPQPRLQG